LQLFFGALDPCPCRWFSFLAFIFSAVDWYVNQIKIPLFQKTAFYISFYITVQLYNCFQKRARDAHIKHKREQAETEKRKNKIYVFDLASKISVYFVFAIVLVFTWRFIRKSG